MKHLVDLRENGKGIYYINCHIVQSSMFLKRGDSMHSPLFCFTTVFYVSSDLSELFERFAGLSR